MQMVLTFNDYEEMEAFCQRVVKGAPLAEAIKPAKKKAPEKEAAPAVEEKETAPVEEAPAEITIEAVREKLAALQKDGKRDAVKELIRSFGVKSLTEISADKYAELMKKAEEL